MNLYHGWKKASKRRIQAPGEAEEGGGGPEQPPTELCESCAEHRYRAEPRHRERVLGELRSGDRLGRFGFRDVGADDGDDPPCVSFLQPAG